MPPHTVPSVPRAASRSPSLESLQKPDRSSATKPGHFICYGQTCCRTLAVLQVLDYADEAFLQFEGLGEFAVDPLVFGIGGQSLHRLAVGFPIGECEDPEDLAGIGARVAVADAHPDRAGP